MRASVCLGRAFLRPKLGSRDPNHFHCRIRFASRLECSCIVHDEPGPQSPAPVCGWMSSALSYSPTSRCISRYSCYSDREGVGRAEYRAAQDKSGHTQTTCLRAQWRMPLSAFPERRSRADQSRSSSPRFAITALTPSGNRVPSIRCMFSQNCRVMSVIT